jgi:lipoprotein-releasing system ATP-binding protein
MTEPVLRFTQVTRTFVQGGVPLKVLKGVDLGIAPGEIVALLGASGAGKSTLLQAAGLLEGGFGGEISIAGQRVDHLSADARTALRRTKLGFVYQFHHLLPDFSAEENVMLPQLIAGVNKQAAQMRARSVLGDLGLGERLSHKPAQLSGGEQQRVAVARALANEPLLILADEPTGNLDEATGRRVLNEFIRLARARGSAALVATHNQELARSMDRVVVLKEGTIVADPMQGKGRLD